MILRNQTVTPDDLRQVDIFADLEPAQLQWLADHAEGMRLDAEDEPFEHGAEARHMMIVLEGGMQIYTDRNGQRTLFGTFHAGTVSGLLPYSRMTHYRGWGVATEASFMALVAKEDFEEMLQAIPVLGERLIGLMSDRVREAAKGDQQREKMLALGKLSAGLAHELNNPAAAVSRGVDALRKRFKTLPDKVAELGAFGLNPERICAVAEHWAEVSCSLEKLSPMEKSEREDELTDWMEDHGVEEAWCLAETFAEAGFTPDDLETLAAKVPTDAVPALLGWVEGTLAADQVLCEIEEATTRISDLVASIKTYSHMDRSPDRQPVALQQGLDSTLTMLGHKLKKNNITIERDFAADLPPVEAYPGELNQVWTNLIDNAADAMPDGGTLTLRSYLEGAAAVVEVEDSGTGIPEDIRERIFEPFYSTKAVGEGTGLGLDIVQRIVERQHGGAIRVASEPGRTVFKIMLPLEVEPAAA